MGVASSWTAANSFCIWIFITVPVLAVHQFSVLLRTTLAACPTQISDVAWQNPSTEDDSKVKNSFIESILTTEDLENGSGCAKIARVYETTAICNECLDSRWVMAVMAAGRRKICDEGLNSIQCIAAGAAGFLNRG